MGYYDYAPTVSLERPLCLTGFLGCGARGVGMTLSARTGLPLADVDRWVEHHGGMSAARLWLQDRERFEALQTEQLGAALRQRPAAVVVLGFSALRERSQLLRVLSASTLWYLERSPEELARRIGRQWDAQRASLPPFALRKPESAADLQPLYDEHVQHYEAAHRRLTAGRQHTHELAQTILDTLPRVCES